ncbi:MAG: hypothetical protein A2Y33_16590 [Spirochaetes bacterium GWF1_51_8]|nr:MAG: hypothetical protein A2Y33_16590 [Spirochaetes bacterium GWF1_51_8]
MSQAVSEYLLSDVNKRFRDVLRSSRIGFIEGYLFGSKAARQSVSDSDWDYLIVLEKEVSGAELRQLTGRLLIEFHKIVPDEPADIIIQSKDAFGMNKNRLNHISNEAFTKGIKI